MNDKLNKKAIDIFKEDLVVYFVAAAVTLAVSLFIPSDGAGIVKYVGYFISYSVQFGLTGFIYLSLTEEKANLKNMLSPFVKGRAVKALMLVSVFVVVNVIVDLVTIVLKDVSDLGSAVGTVIGIIRVLFLPSMCLFIADSSKKTGQYLKVASDIMIENFGGYVTVAFKYFIGFMIMLILVFYFATIFKIAAFLGLALGFVLYILLQIDLIKFIAGVIPRDF